MVVIDHLVLRGYDLLGTCSCLIRVKGRVGVAQGSVLTWLACCNLHEAPTLYRPGSIGPGIQSVSVQPIDG